MKLIRGTIIVLCLLAIVFGCWKIYGIQSGYRQGQRAYEELEAYITLPDPVPAKVPPVTAPVDEDAAETAHGETAPAFDVTFPEVDFEALRKTNPGVVGWIYGEDTPINYPIAQGPNNDYYLDHLFNGTLNTSGSIYLDSRNNRDYSDTNSILYGHNLKSGAMFAALTNYKQQSYYEEHPRFLLMTPEANYVVEVFASVIMPEWGKAWQTTFADDTELDCWIADILSESEIQTGIAPTMKDRILTLSTCSYEYERARMTVFGILRKA